MSPPAEPRQTGPLPETDPCGARWRVQVHVRETDQKRRDHAAFAATEREAVRRLRQSIVSGRTIAQIAADLGWSPRAFQAQFRDVVGVTPAELRAWMRVDLALDLLHANPNVAGSTLSRAMGLASPAAVERLMHRLTGETTQTWRTRIAFDLMRPTPAKMSHNWRPTRG